jgi:tetratricopeptide (TPR) repeat protein
VLLRRALRLLGDDPDDAELRVRVLCTLAYSDAEERSFEDGVAHLRTARTLLPKVPEPRVRDELGAIIEAQHGLLLMRVGRFAQSIDVLGSAITMAEKANAQGAANHFVLGSNLINRGLAYVESGRAAGPAQRDMRRSIEVAEAGMRAGDDYRRLAILAAKGHHNLGVVAWRVNDIPLALRHYREAAAMFAELDPTVVPQLRIAEGDALLAAGLAGEAARHFDEALPRMREHRDHQNLAGTEASRAVAALIDDDYATARRMARSARRRFQRRGSPSWVAIASLIVLRADVAEALQRGKMPPALVASALALADELAALTLVDEAALARMLAVRILIRRGAVDEAAQQLALVPAPRQVTPVDHRMLRRLCRAELAAATGRRRVAFAQASGGLAELARMRDRMGDLELVGGPAVHGRELGELAVRLVLEQPRSAARRLFTWLERTRAQTYRYQPLPPPDNPELAERVQQYRMLSRDMQEARLAGQRISTLAAQRAALQREIMRMGWREGPWGEPRPIAGFDDVAAHLGNRALISFVVSGALIAAVVVVDGHARLVRLGATGSAVAAVRELRADLDALSPDHLPGPIAAAVSGSARLRANRLDEQLMRPLADVAGGRELVIVPTGVLNAVAWGTLPSLLGRPVSVAPSATAWLTSMLAPAQQGGTLLAAGPDLRAAEAEIGLLREYYPDATLLDGERAGVREVLAALDGARLAHLAAHGTHEPENALFSWLQLANGALYAHEMSLLRRPPEHVVLAACELALARIRPGDEALGFAGALLAIGCRTVTAPLTRVGDLAAATAMTDYHKRLAAGAPPAVALAQTTEVDPLRRPFVSLGASRD